VARVPHFLVAPTLVARTDLIVTLPGRLAQLATAALGLRRFDPPLDLPPFAIQMAWHIGVDDDAASRWLREELASTLTSLTRKR
jgi:DNA-binding transcriptional LysR family regulator